MLINKPEEKPLHTHVGENNDKLTHPETISKEEEIPPHHTKAPTTVESTNMNKVKEGVPLEVN